MTSPALNTPFDPYYDLLSVKADEVIIPSYFDQYVPDNQDDYNCISVISPSLSKGAKKWTQYGKWITIGIYRDEGRSTTRRPAGTATWIRTGTSMVLTDMNPHFLRAGDKVNLYNVNVAKIINVTVVSITDLYTFSVTALHEGATSGTGSYQHNFDTDFYADFRVFRFLPSFQLVPFSIIQQIFTDSAPITQPATRTLYNITTGTSSNVPSGNDSNVNYTLPNRAQPIETNLSLQSRFSQAYNESGKPLKMSYQGNGYPVQYNNVDSNTKNKQTFMNLPVNPNGDSKIYVRDYYGLELNDATRGPYFSESIVTRNASVAGNLTNFTVESNNGIPVYSKTLNDSYGNLAIGVQTNNALVVRKQILPLALDRYNRPIKSPL